MVYLLPTHKLTTSSLLALLRKSTLKHSRIVFERLTTHGIVINPNKCLFGVSALDFPDHHIDQHGITRLPEKVQTIDNFPQPHSQRQLHPFIGLVNFY